MIWKDWLYFSAGEKKALCVLVCLIVAATYLLSLRNTPLLEKTETEQLQKKYAVFSQEILRKEKAKEKTNVQGKKRSSHMTRSLPTSGYKKEYKQSFPVTTKYKPGTVIELNGADTFSLKMIPGIGSTFARRIVKYRNLLHGYVTVEQLREVYGIDEVRYKSLVKWFKVDKSWVKPLKVNVLPADSLRKHPYINYRQAKVLEQLRVQKGKVSGWESLMLMEEFSEKDKERLEPYLSFE